MNHLSPNFPPLLSGHLVNPGFDLALKAKSGIAKGRWSAGDFLWTDEVDKFEFALVLEPEVKRERCGEILYMAMVALSDALGTLCPPEVAIHFQWPHRILVNGADAGTAGLLISDKDTDGVPDWMVLSCLIRLLPDNREIEPGDDISLTNLWDEGCGELSKVELVESSAKYLISWIHNWQEEGFKPVYDQWWGRRAEKIKLAPDLFGVDCELNGMDENGNALISEKGANKIAETIASLEKIHGGRAS